MIVTTNLRCRKLYIYKRWWSGDHPEREVPRVPQYRNKNKVNHSAIPPYLLFVRKAKLFFQRTFNKLSFINCNPNF